MLDLVPERSALRSHLPSSDEHQVAFRTKRKKTPGYSNRLSQPAGWKNPFPFSEPCPQGATQEDQLNSENSRAENCCSGKKWWKTDREHLGIVTELRDWKLRAATISVAFAPAQEQKRKKGKSDVDCGKIVRKEFDANGIFYWVGTNAR